MRNCHKNILLDEKNHVRYADFGSAFFEHLRPEQSARQAVTQGLQVTTLCFRAPEILLGGPFGMPCDIWSIACVVYALLTGDLPWRASLQGELLKKMFIRLGSPVENGWSQALGYPNYGRFCSGHHRRYIGEHVPFEFGDLMDSMLALNPSRRLSAVAFYAAASQVRIAQPQKQADCASSSCCSDAAVQIVQRQRQVLTRGVQEGRGRPRKGPGSRCGHKKSYGAPLTIPRPSMASKAPKSFPGPPWTPITPANLLLRLIKPPPPVITKTSLAWE